MSSTGEPIESAEKSAGKAEEGSVGKKTSTGKSEMNNLLGMMRDVMNVNSSSGGGKRGAAGSSSSSTSKGKMKNPAQSLFSALGDLDDGDDDDDGSEDDDDNLKQFQTGLGESDLDLKTVDMLTKKIAQDLGTGFLDTSDEDEEDDVDEDEDDAEFRARLMQEFKRLQSPASALGSDDAEPPVAKQRMKQLYLNLLQQGSSIMRDKSVADQFMSKLDAMELTSLMNILQMDPQSTIRYFNNDPEVIEAIQSTPSVAPSTASSLWKDLTEDDLLEDDDDGEDDGTGVSSHRLRTRASTAVKEALKVFESNLVLYSQQPQQLLALCDKLPTEKDQQTFLDILFQEYTPEKMEQRIKAEKYAMESEMKKKQEKMREAVDTDLVAHVFKEVFTHFRTYKKRPERFDALVNRLGDSDSLEQQMFESLVKAFWDLEIEKVKL